MGLLGADLDAVDGVDHVHETGEADLDVVVDADAGVLLDGLLQQLRPAVRERRVDLRGAVPGHVDDGVAGDGHQQVRAGAGVQQHDRVGAAALALADAVAELLLAGQALAGVAAHEQVRRPGLRGGPVAAGRRVDLVDLGPRDERHRDQEDQPERQHQLDPTEPGPPPAARGRDGEGRRGAVRARRHRRSRRSGPAPEPARGRAGGGVSRGRRTASAPAGRRSGASGSARGRWDRTAAAAVGPGWRRRPRPGRGPADALASGAVEPVEAGLVHAGVGPGSVCHGRDGTAQGRTSPPRRRGGMTRPVPACRNRSDACDW